MYQYIIKAGLIVAVVNSIAMLMVWWTGALNQWLAIIKWNNLGEGPLEGVLLHLSVVIAVVALTACVIKAR